MDMEDGEVREMLQQQSRFLLYHMALGESPAAGPIWLLFCNPDKLACFTHSLPIVRFDR